MRVSNVLLGTIGFSMLLFGATTGCSSDDGGGGSPATGGGAGTASGGSSGSGGTTAGTGGTTGGAGGSTAGSGGSTAGSGGSSGGTTGGGGSGGASGGMGGMGDGGAGGDSGGAGGDGGAGGGGGDSPECTTYCTGMDGVVQKCGGETTVMGTFTDEADCLSQCGAQANWDLACRQMHLGLAAMNDETHCPHTVGQNGQCADM